MAINGTLQLNTNYIQNGLGTLTFTVPATLVNGGAVLNTPFTVQCQVTAPQAVAQGSGSGSGIDLGLGVTGGIQGIGQGSNLSLGNGGLGLGFGGTATDNAAAITPLPLILSGLSIVVNKNGTPVYTAPAFGGDQEAFQFKTSFLTTAADSITVVFSSSTLTDEQLHGIKANVSIWNGQ